MLDYAFDQGFADERKRLSAMESLWDPGSEALLVELGVGAGWRSFEVGAGGGSMARWMAGRGAHVTAVDIDTRFIEQFASDRIEVQRVDVRTDALPQASPMFEAKGAHAWSAHAIRGLISSDCPSRVCAQRSSSPANSMVKTSRPRNPGSPTTYGCSPRSWLPESVVGPDPQRNPLRRRHSAVTGARPS